MTLNQNELDRQARRVLGCYFHLDWSTEYLTIENAVKAICTEEIESIVHMAYLGLIELSHKSEQELQTEYFTRIDQNLGLRFFGLTRKTFIDKIVSEIKKNMGYGVEKKEKKGTA